MSELDSIERSTHQQKVVERLRKMILEDEFPGGARLMEPQLSRLLEVSRTPIREALIALAEEGLVEGRPNRGFVVRSFKPKDIQDAFVAREIIESHACRILSEIGVDRPLKLALQECLDEGDKLLSGQTVSANARVPWGELNHRFHSLIVEGAGNWVLIDAMRRIINIPYSSTHAVHWFDEDDLEGQMMLRLAHVQHHNIYHALCAGEGYRAEGAMRAHIATTAEHVGAQYLSGGRPTAVTKLKTLKSAPSTLNRP